MHFHFHMEDAFPPHTLPSLSPDAANLQMFSFALGICHFNRFAHLNEIVRCTFFPYRVQGENKLHNEWLFLICFQINFIY